MNLENTLISHNNEYFSIHNVPGDGDCYFRSVCLSPDFPLTDHRELRARLCSGLRNILRFPHSEEYKFVTTHYSHSHMSKSYSIESYLKYRMCHDGTWGSTFEMLLTALIFDVQVISLADKPGHLWPSCTAGAATLSSDEETQSFIYLLP